jgi:hypothetical protein
LSQTTVGARRVEDLLVGRFLEHERHFGRPRAKLDAG